MLTNEEIEERVKVIIYNCTLGYPELKPERKLEDINFRWETMSLPEEIKQLFLPKEVPEELYDDEATLENNPLLLTDEEVESFGTEIETVGDFINKAIAFYPKVLTRS